MSVHEHKQEVPSAVRCKVITVSDTRTKETDKSGRVMMDFLRKRDLKRSLMTLLKMKKMNCRKPFYPAVWMNIQMRCC